MSHHRIPGRVGPTRPELVIGAGLLALVLLLSLFGLHGSSVGMFHRVFHGPEVVDSDLLAFEPRAIRSDEWLRWTPLVVSQARLGYPEVNTALRDGVDLSLIDDIPHGGWTALFEPHHALFHLGLGVEFAFSFKWFGLLATTFFAAFLFARRFADLPTGLSLLFAVFWSASPFFHWWFQGQAFLPVSYALIILVLMKPMLAPASLRRRILSGVVVGYLGSAIVIVQYPPFVLGALLPCVVVIAAEVVGRARIDSAVVVGRRLLVPGGIALVLAATVVTTFVVTKGDQIQAVSASEHPGDRSFVSGRGDRIFASHLLSSNLAPYLLDDEAAQQYFTNQSEAANFYLVLPFVVVFVAVWQFRRWRRHQPVDPASIGLSLLAAVVLVWMFVPGLTPLFRPLAFGEIPLHRFVYLLGVVQFLVLVRVAQLHHEGRDGGEPDALGRRDPVGEPGLAWVGGVVAIALFSIVVANREITRSLPGFVDGVLVAVLAATLLLVGLGLFLAGRVKPALIVWCGLSVATVVSINPLYRGLDPVRGTPIVAAIESLAATDPLATWVILGGGLEVENLAVQAGARSLSGSAPQTQIEYWSEHFSDAPEVEFVYDRSAHFVFEFTEEETEFVLLGRNLVQVFFDPCGPYAERVDLGFVVSAGPLDVSCLYLVEVVDYPRRSFWLYRHG